jgi:GNAT superfamily N-acetyltransferase
LAGAILLQWKHRSPRRNNGSGHQSRSGRVPEIGLIMVHPAMQGLGIARALLHHAAEEMQARGCDVIESRYRLVSDQARQWYQRQGFTELPNRLSARLLARRAECLMAGASTSPEREQRAQEYEALEWLARRT